MGVTTFEAPTEVRTLVAGEPLHSAPEAKVLTTGSPVVPYTFGIGAGLSSTTVYYLKFYYFKGSVSRDFRLPVFFMIRTHLGP